jgi:hypothetical protein
MSVNFMPWQASLALNNQQSNLLHALAGQPVCQSLARIAIFYQGQPGMYMVGCTKQGLAGKHAQHWL